MKVVEIFQSIQGEGKMMGTWVTFIRFAGCNLQCSFCDEASKYSKATEMSIKDIVTKVWTTNVVLTGGEPTIQPDLIPLCNALHKAGKHIAIETNGTNDIPEDTVDWVTCSPKAPDYKVPPTGFDEMKLVVSEDISETTLCRLSDYTVDPVWLQPCDGPYIEKSMERIIKLVSKYPQRFRAGIQLHKYYKVV